MAQQEKKPSTMTRRGQRVYRENPSLADHFPARLQSGKPTKLSSAYMVAPGTGEVVAEGAFGFVQEKIVDSEEFVKIYLAGIRRYGELSKSGATLFEFVYRQLSGHAGKDRDTVDLNYALATDWSSNLSRRTYARGMSELLEKGFIYRSMVTDTYFVNVRFMFNGNRMVLVESYRRKERKGASPQAELAFDERPMLTAPATES
jgi:hypothetical protein